MKKVTRKKKCKVKIGKSYDVATVSLAEYERLIKIEKAAREIFQNPIACEDGDIVLMTVYSYNALKQLFITLRFCKGQYGRAKNKG